jgi:hypothetical protein
MLRKSTLSLTMAFMVAGLALAARPAAAFTKGACKEDIKRFCADVKPGKGAIRDCLKAHEADLSQACKDNMAEAKDKAKGFHQACGDDVKKFCGDVKPGKGGIRDCLKTHANDLSPACKESITKGRHHHKSEGESEPNKPE